MKEESDNSLNTSLEGNVSEITEETSKNSMFDYFKKLTTWNKKDPNRDTQCQGNAVAEKWYNFLNNCQKEWQILGQPAHRNTIIKLVECFAADSLQFECGNIHVEPGLIIFENNNK